MFPNKLIAVELSYPLSPNVPSSQFQPPFFFTYFRRHEDSVARGFKDGITVQNDFFVMGGHTGTHVDAQIHIGKNGVWGPSVDQMSAHELIGRGLLLDVAGYKKLDYLAELYGITDEDLVATAKTQGVVIKPRDVVLVRTGWDAVGLRDINRYVEKHPFITESAAYWLARKKVKAVGVDMTNIDSSAIPDIFFLKAHRVLLVEGKSIAGEYIYAIENLTLSELARKRKYEFLFVALPLRIVGGTASPIRPVALIE